MSIKYSNGSDPAEQYWSRNISYRHFKSVSKNDKHNFIWQVLILNSNFYTIKNELAKMEQGKLASRNKNFDDKYYIDYAFPPLLSSKVSYQLF